MARNPPEPAPTSKVGARIRVHSLVITTLLVVIALPLVGELATRFNVAAAPDASGGIGAGQSTSPSPTSSQAPAPLPTPVPNGRLQVVYAAGDLSDCPGAGPAVADLVSNPQSLILALGDIVHPTGAPREYRRCFDPGWGDLKARTRPVPGNHDYHTPGAAGYYAYWGALAGNRSQGYYSFDIGWWHIVAINSICAPIGGCRENSREIRWLQADLGAHPTTCTLAYWHHPRFSSGNGAALRRTEYLWRVLYGAGADVILNGHDHDYERFAPQDPDGERDNERGIREFVVGTGGANLTRRETVAPNSQIWTDEHHGLLELTLHRGGYDWRFIAAETGEVIDQGTGTCH